MDIESIVIPAFNLFGLDLVKRKIESRFSTWFDLSRKEAILNRIDDSLSKNLVYSLNGKSIWGLDKILRFYERYELDYGK